MTNEEIYKASLIAGLKLFGYRPDGYNNSVKKYAKKWKIDLKEYPLICRTGVCWGIEKEYNIIKEKLTERAFDLMTDAGEDETDWVFETGDFEYIFHPKTGEGITDVSFFSTEVKDFIVENTLYTFVGENGSVYENKFDIHSIKEFKETKTYKEILKQIKKWEEENK